MSPSHHLSTQDFHPLMDCPQPSSLQPSLQWKGVFNGIWPHPCSQETLGGFWIDESRWVNEMHHFLQINFTKILTCCYFLHSRMPNHMQSVYPTLISPCGIAVEVGVSPTSSKIIFMLHPLWTTHWVSPKMVFLDEISRYPNIWIAQIHSKLIPDLRSCDFLF